MNKRFNCLHPSQVSLLSLSLALLAIQYLTDKVSASPIPPLQTSSQTTDVVATVGDRPRKLTDALSFPETFWSFPEFSSLPEEFTQPIVIDEGDTPVAQSDSQDISTIIAEPSQAVDTQIVQLPIGRRGLLIEEIRGEVNVNGQPAQLNEFLQEPGTLITTGNNSTARLRIDSNIGVVEVAPNTTVELQTVSGSAGASGNQITVFTVTGGRIRLSISRFVSDIFRNLLGEDKLNQIAALDTLNGLGEFDDIAQESRSVNDSPLRIETPVGVAGVRGTSFGVAVGPSGKTGVSTIDGIVGVFAQGREEIVNSGFFSTINVEGEPTTAASTPSLSTLQRFTVIRTGSNTVRLLGRVDPMDIVYVNGQAIETDAEGNFEYAGNTGNGRVKIVVRGPSVRERHYSLTTR